MAAPGCPRSRLYSADDVAALVRTHGADRLHVWPRPANTGIGDRLGQYIMVAAMARMLNLTGVLTYWADRSENARETIT